MIDCLLVNGVYTHSSGTDFEDYLKKKLTSNINFSGFFHPYTTFEAFNAMTYLEEQGISCQCFISLSNNEEEIVRILKKGVRIVSVMSYVNNVHDYKKIVNLVRQYGVEAKLVISGSFLKNLLNKLNVDEKKHIFQFIGADLYIDRYECQTELLAYINQCKTRINREIPNTIYKSGKDYYFSKKDYSTTYIDEYPIHWDRHTDLISSIAGLRTTINCNFACAFCAIKDSNDQFTMVPVEKINQDIKTLKKYKEAKSVFFLDETINYPEDRFKTLLKSMIQNQHGINWFSFFRCQYIDDITARLTRESGCTAAILGIESGNDQMLEKMNKQVNSQQLYNGIQALKKANIITVALFVVGFPGETQETLKDTLEFINASKPDFFVINPWTCEIGTPIWKEREKYSLKYNNGNWKHATMEFNQIDEIIKTMEKQVTGSTNIRTMDFTNIIELLHHGYPLATIHNLVNEYWAAKEKQI